MRWLVSEQSNTGSRVNGFLRKNARSPHCNEIVREQRMIYFSSQQRETILNYLDWIMALCAMWWKTVSLRKFRGNHKAGTWKTWVKWHWNIFCKAAELRVLFAYRRLSIIVEIKIASRNDLFWNDPWNYVCFNFKRSYDIPKFTRTPSYNL